MIKQTLLPLAFLLAYQLGFSQSSFFWEITHPETGQQSYLLGYLNLQDTRARIAAEGWRPILAQSDLVLTTDNPYLRRVEEVHFDMMQEEGYLADLKSNGNFDAVNDQFREVFRVGLDYSYTSRMLVESIARHRGPNYATSEFPIDYFFKSSGRAGIATEHIATSGIDLVSKLVPSSLWESYILRKIDLTAANREDRIFFDAFKRGDEDFFRQWRTEADDLHYILRTDLVKSLFLREERTILTAILDHADEKTLFVPISVPHLYGKEGILQQLENQGFDIQEINARRISFPALKEAGSNPELTSYSERNLPFDIDLPGNPDSFDNLTLGNRKGMLSCTVIPIYPFERAVFSIWRVPVGQMDANMTDQEMRYWMQSLPGILDRQFDNNLPIVTSELKGKEVYLFEGSPFQGPGINLLPGAQKERSLMFKPGRSRKTIGYVSGYELIILSATGLSFPIETDIIDQIFASLRWKEQPSWNHQEHEKGFEADFPGYPFQADFAVNYGPAGDSMQITYWGGMSKDLRERVDLRTGIFPRGVFIVNDSLEIQSFVMGEQRFLSFRKHKDIEINLKDDAHLPFRVGQLNYSWIDENQGFISPPTVLSSHFHVGGRYYNLLLSSSDAESEIFDDWLSRFREIPFPSPPLTRYSPSDSWYSLLLPDSPVTVPLEVPEEMNPTLTSILHTRWVAQDSISGISLTGFESEVSALAETSPDAEADFTLRQIRNFFAFRPGDVPVLIRDSSFVVNQMPAREFYLDLPKSRNQLRVLYVLNGNKKMILLAAAPPRYLFSEWLNSAFYQIQAERVIPPTLFDNHAKEIITILQSGTETEVDTALFSLYVSQLSDQSVDDYLHYLETDPPYMHPDQYEIFPTLIAPLYAANPDRTDAVVRNILKINQDPSLQLLLLNTLLNIDYQGIGATIYHGIQNTNWNGFEGEIGPLYEFIEASFQIEDGGIFWQDIHELTQYSFWESAIDIYLPQAEEKGFLAMVDLPALEQRLLTRLAETTQRMLDDDQDLSEGRSLNPEQELAGILNALSIFSPPKKIKKTFNGISPKITDENLRAQLDYNRIAWGMKIEEDQIIPWLDQPLFRKKFLMIIRQTGLTGERIDRYNTKEMIAETDMYLAITQGYVDIVPSTFRLEASWEESNGKRFVYFVKMDHEEEGIYILSPLYGENPLEPLQTADAYSTIPESQFDRLESAKDQFDFQNGL